MFRTAVCRSRSRASREESPGGSRQPCGAVAALGCKDPVTPLVITVTAVSPARDRKSTRLNSSHITISYAVFCLKKKKKQKSNIQKQRPTHDTNICVLHTQSCPR